jgi:hypothetical protein
MFSPIYDFKITELDIENLPIEIFTFSKKCADQGLINNASPAAMKIGRWGKDNEAWWCTWIDGEIVSISGCCTFDEYRPDYWRLMFRTATLKEYRGKAPGSIRTIKTDFNWGYILPYQYEFAKSKAKKLVFTTNSTSDGERNSYRTDRAIRKVLEPQGIVKLVEQDVEIFYTKQNVWELLKLP